VIQARLRTPKDEATAISIAGFSTVLLGVYDHLLVFYAARHGMDGYGSFTLTRYSLLLFIITMGWVLFTRYHKQQKELSDAQCHFELELTKHRLALEAAFDRQQISSSDSIRHIERDRIMMDIHDGLGLQLQSLLAQVEESPYPKELAQEVRITIDQMRMLVSNTEQFNEDLTLVLGEIRYQLGRRLRQSRIKFSWQAPRITEKINFSNDRCVALQRWFFELTTNVIRHAKAQEVCVEISIDAHLQPHRLHICFADDGDGYDGSAVHMGEGMRSLKIRTKDLQSVMTSDGRPGTGAVTQLSIPL
jgi:signal transduction histidine kinase